MITLAIVVPCYNEEEVLPETTRRLLDLLERLTGAGKVAPGSGVHYVDDGSKDRTWALITEQAARYPQIHGIKLSRNRGHQNALLAGLFTVPGDIVVSIDADLQDDVSAIEAMVDAHLRGADVVYGVRRLRATDDVFKRNTALAFYRLMGIFGAESVYNHADFRLMTRRAIDGLKQFGEINLFLRGLVPLVGFPSEIVTYDRAQRFAGVSKYPLRKMLAFAVEGITSFSVVPLRMITTIGFITFFASLLMSLWVLYVRIFSTTAVPGWTSTVLPIYFIGGIQILCMGIMGEYVGKIYGEVKNRPRYIVEQVI